MFYAKPLAAVLTVVSTLLLVAASCGGRGGGAQREDHQAKASANRPPLAVQTVTLSPVRWPETFEATGSVRPRVSAQIAARVMGYVKEVRVQTGDRVTAGQLLVRVEAREIEAAHKQSQAALAEARSGISEVEAAIAGANAQLDLARVTLKRMQDLLDKRSISQQEFDEAAARVRVAEAGRASALARKQQLEERIRQAEQAVASAATMLSYVDLAAPFAGRVAARKADPGTLATPGQPLLELEQEGAWRLEAAIEETRLGSVRPGQSASVKLEALDEVFNSRVSEIVPAVDPASRSFVAKLDLPARPVMRTGLFGRAEFRTGEREVLAVPERAVVRQGQVDSVFVADQGIARARLVRLGATREGHVEVLSGLAPGDRIIHPRPAALADGERVQ